MQGEAGRPDQRHHRPSATTAEPPDRNGAGKGLDHFRGDQTPMYVAYYGHGHKCILLDDLTTPAALIDEARLLHNIQHMQSRLKGLGVRLRPHVKTAKCLPVAERQRAASDSAAPSTSSCRNSTP